MELEEFLELKINKNPELENVQALMKRTSTKRKTDEECEQCEEKQIYCGFDDLGSPDHDYHWWHICLNCFDVKYVNGRACYGYEKEGDEDCTFCGYRWYPWPEIKKEK